MHAISHPPRKQSFVTLSPPYQPLQALCAPTHTFRAQAHYDEHQYRTPPLDSLIDTMDTQQQTMAGDPEGARQRMKRKFRPRVSQACQMCRVKKAKCDQGRPCQTCVDREFVCTYDPSRRRRGRASSLNEFATPGTTKLEIGSPSELSQIPASPQRMSFENMGQRPAENGVVQESESVEALNKHTGGTEFYGKSSSVALLSQLFTKTRRKSLAEHTSPQSVESGESGLGSSTVSKMSPHGNDQMAIVNILYDENSAIPESRPGSPVVVAGRRKVCAPGHRAEPAFKIPAKPQSSSQSPTIAGESKADLQKDAQRPAGDPVSALSTCLFGQPLLLEVEYVALYFRTLHYMAPFLTHSVFRSRCEQEIWSKQPSERLRRDQMHFLALYNAVLAVASLTSGVDLYQELRTELDTTRFGAAPADPNDVVSNYLLSKIYFQRARKLLGNVFEVSSLESTQTLLLLSIYCQQALKPHSAFLYSGMAARTAVSIGLGTSAQEASEAQKTWWNIYSHETEISCSSGRPSSLSTFEEYDIPLPAMKKPWQPGQSTSEECHILIVAQLARLYAILQRASKDIYHSSTVALQLKSRRASEYDEELNKWKLGLPRWLAPGMIEWREPEWAIKQKLSLQLRYYHARMFLHRAFISTPQDETNPNHVYHCEAFLQTARRIISVIYDAYMHRHYFRYVWYNCTYTLHACVAILYIIMIRVEKLAVPTADLIADVEKGLKVLEAMSDMVVSSRCATLVRDILGSLNTTSRSMAGPTTTHLQDRPEVAQTQSLTPENQNTQATHTEVAYDSYQDPTNISHNWLTNFNASRDDILANLMDANIMQDFATDFSDQSPQNFNLNLHDMRWEMEMPFDFGGNLGQYRPS